MDIEKDVPYWMVSSTTSQLLALFGFIFIIKCLKKMYDLMIWFLRVYSPSLYRPYKYIHKYGQWAAVTGCTSGIGLGFAKELANRGINVILISRSKDKLETLSSQIEKEYNVKTKIIVTDATDRHSTHLLSKELAQMDIGILVNNVGLNYTDLRRFFELSHDNILDLITVNTGNSVILSKYILPNMIKSRKGIVINLCSAGSYFPLPIQQLYSATKVYLDVLTKCIRNEVKSSGVEVQSVCPILVQSNMTMTTSDLIYNVFSITSATYAKSVLNILGTNDRVSGYWVFDFIFWIYHTFIYESWILYIIYYGTVLLKVTKI